MSSIFASQKSAELFTAATGKNLSADQALLLGAMLSADGFDWTRRSYNFIQIAGYRFGRLEVVGPSVDHRGIVKWLCRCDCGNYSQVYGANLKSGRQSSCGCLRDEVRKIVAASSRVTKEQKLETRRRANRKYRVTEKNQILQLEYRRKNRDKLLARSRLRHMANPEATRSSVRNRRARLRNAEGKHSQFDIRLIGDEQGWVCPGCDVDISNAYHADHVVALANGGSNWPSNIQLMCGACNLSKSTKTLGVFMALKWPDLYKNHKDIE